MTRIELVALVTSAGGLEALSTVLRALPADFPCPIVAGQHLSGSGSELAEILMRRSRLVVVWLEPGMKLEPGRLHVCRPRTLVEVRPDGTCAIAAEHYPPNAHPFDYLLRSIAESYGTRALAAVLTGTGTDGARGTAALRKAGGTVIAQSEDTAQHPGMPRAAIDAGADLVVPLHEIGRIVAAHVYQNC